MTTANTPTGALTASFGAVGVSVTDLQRSADFYTRVLGMKVLTTFTLDHMDEIVLGFEGGRGSSIVLMQWKDGKERAIRDQPLKLVFYVSDPAELARRIRAEGLPIVREPTPVPALGNAIVGFAKDPDGTLIEILQARKPAA